MSIYKFKRMDSMKLKALALALMCALTSGCQTIGIPSNPYQNEVQAQRVKYEPLGKVQFIFNTKTPGLQRYGYNDFCPRLNEGCISSRIDYKTYVGMKGYFNSDDPVNKTIFDSTYDVVLENGEKFYFTVSKSSKDRFSNAVSPIMRLTDFNEIKYFKPVPLVPGSNVILISLENGYFGKKYKLSTGHSITDGKLEVLRGITKELGGKHEIAEILLGMTIDRDEIEDRYFIHSTGGHSKSGAKLYIGLKDGLAWLRFKVKYYDDDWLFVNSFKVAADKYRWESHRVGFKRDHADGNVWEWHDYSVDAELLGVVKKLAYSKSSTIRFNGSKYYSDKVLSSEQKSALTSMLQLYSVINKKI